MYRELVVCKRAIADAHDRHVVLAWNIAALERQKQLPELSRLLRQRTTQQQTRAQQVMQMQMISARFGLPIRRVRLVH